MLQSLLVLTLWGAAWAGPDGLSVAPVATVTPAESVDATPQDPAVSAPSALVLHGAALQHAADRLSRTGAAEARAAGRASLGALAGLLVASPDLVTHDAGRAITALCAWSDATGDGAALSVAVATAEWALSDRRLEGSGFSGQGQPSAPARLADSVAMGQALQALYGSTGDPRWLSEALATAGFIGSRFLGGGRGFASVSSLDAERVVLASENVDTVVFVAWLGHVTGDPRWSGMARHGLAWLRAAPGAESGVAALAVEERPLHMVVVGPRSDPDAQAQFNAARALPAETRWLEWRDPQHWVAAPSAVQVSLSGPPATWVCDGHDCGSPLRSPGEIAALRTAAEERPVADGAALDTAAP